jgi:hypothetical protein
MKLVRMTFLALAVLLPTSWTIARAADEPPAGEEKTPPKKKSSKKGKKGEGEKTGTEKKGESDTGK